MKWSKRWNHAASWWRCVCVCMLCMLCMWMNVAWANDAKGGFVWKVTAQNQTQSYLIGTLHVGAVNTPLPAKYQQALSQSRLLVVESQDEDWEGVDGAAYKIALNTMMLSQKSLGEHWGSDRIQKINQLLRQKNSPLAGVLSEQSPFAPWMAYMLLVTDYSMGAYTLENGVDVLLQKQAQLALQPIVSLEQLEAIAMFQRIPNDVLIRAVDAHLQNHEQEQAQQLQLIEAYYQGNSEWVMNKVLNQKESTQYLPEQDRVFWQRFLFDDLLQKRNEAWIGKIERHFKQQPTTVAVGAAHLFGEHGLIALLRARGFQVEPVN